MVKNINSSNQLLKVVAKTLGVAKGAIKQLITDKVISYELIDGQYYIDADEVRAALPLNLQHLHNRLEQGEHILVVDWGNLNEAVFSIWYAEDDKGKYIQILGKDGAVYHHISGSGAQALQSYAVDLEDGMDIRSFEAYSTELRFLESDRLEIKKDNFSKQHRIMHDYQELLSLVHTDYLNKTPYKEYQNTLNKLSHEFPEYAL